MGESNKERWSSFTLVNHVGLGNLSSLPDEVDYYNGYYYITDDEDNSTDNSTSSIKIDFLINDYQWANDA